MQRKVKLLLFFLLIFLFFSCATKTPSQYELNTRSNLTPSVNLEGQAISMGSGNAHFLSDPIRASEMPVRTEPNRGSGNFKNQL